MLSNGFGDGHIVSPTSAADTEAERWVTIFGFPQGYQDGVLRYMRDRGEIGRRSICHSGLG
eukprot:768452-Hanusia_phi.AAC.4